VDLLQEHANTLTGSVEFCKFGKGVVSSFFGLGLRKELDGDGSRIALCLSENLGCRKNSSTIPASRGIRWNITFGGIV
jgi:hypothetical protein